MVIVSTNSFLIISINFMNLISHVKTKETAYLTYRGYIKHLLYMLYKNRYESFL
jgi:hypothetical protein